MMSTFHRPPRTFKVVSTGQLAVFRLPCEELVRVLFLVMRRNLVSKVLLLTFMPILAFCIRQS